MFWLIYDHSLCVGPLPFLVGCVWIKLYASQDQYIQTATHPVQS